MRDGDVTRSKILEALRSCRGIHKSGLCRQIRIGWGNVGHHVNVLETQGQITTETRGRLLWLFLPGLSKAERDWIVATTPHQRNRILAVLGFRERASIRTLSEELAVSKKVIRTHLGHLESVGAIKQGEGYPPKFELVHKKR